MPEKIPIEENEEFKSIRNAVVSAVRDIHTPPVQPDYAVDHDYSKLKEHANNFDYLYRYANRYDDPIGYYRLGRYYLEKTDDMENAEWWLRMAADEGNSLSAYLIYKAYRDGKFDETPSDKMKYLRMAADAKFGYAEYEYEDYEAGKEYMHRAADAGYESAKEAIRAIEHNLNAQIVIGVCDLFYYASNIIDDRAEDMYSKEHQVNYLGIDKKQRREIRAKKQAQGHTMSW